MTHFTSIISFRIALVLGVFMLLNFNAYSQSKKEQILILSNRLDSLKTIEINENKSFIEEKNNLTKEFNILQSQNELLTV